MYECGHCHDLLSLLLCHCQCCRPSQLTGNCQDCWWLEEKVLNLLLVIQYDCKASRFFPETVPWLGHLCFVSWLKQLECISKLVFFETMMSSYIMIRMCPHDLYTAAWNIAARALGTIPSSPAVKMNNKEVVRNVVRVCKKTLWM